MNSQHLNEEKQQEAKRWVWVPCNKELFKPAYILSETDLEVRVQSNIIETFRNTEVFKMNPDKFNKAEDLAFLSHLNEPSVLHNLQMRYFDSLIYTYSGLFLIALNPYRALGIYADDYKKSVINKKYREGEPHIFALANEAYRCMLCNKVNQSILITGESGAGKTENTKRVIEFLAYVASNSDTKSIESLLMCANPILEAFGNAKTVKNDNSSRFGKFIQLKFKGGNICGARIEKFLLEKSRVVRQNKGERSYHIFYYLLKGATPNLSKRLQISGNPADYRCLKDSCYTVEGVDDAIEFEKLNNFFNQIGIEDPSKYYSLVAAIMHLSNIEFIDKNDSTVIKDESPIEIACKLLNISSNEFIKETLYPTIRAGSESVLHHRTIEESYKVVEGFMKLIYDSLFDNLAYEINAVLDKSFSDCFIGVLDIAGFEIFEKNSFEQLCINYTNEKLQQFFNHHMFVLEQEIYRNEQIEWNFIDFGLDLEPTIKVIESNNPIGILSYLDEECVMPKASDITLLDKIKSISSIEKCPFSNSFKLKHYAGQVEYEVSGWLDKNKDVHSVTLHNLISNLFSTKYNDMNLKKGIFRTVGQSHRENLRRLMELLRNTNPHFVRCILPNLEKSSEKFAKKLILDQLRCNGVLEGIRISRLGYPTRISISDFTSRYLILSEDSSPDISFISPDIQTDNSSSTEHKKVSFKLDRGEISDLLIQRNLAMKILKDINISPNDHKVGNTMVFIKQGILADIEEMRDRKIGALASYIQSVLRSKIEVRKKNLEQQQKQAIEFLQKNANKSIDLLRWKWWSLFIKIKPLLEVQKNEENIKLKEEQIKAYSELIDKERNEKKSLEEQVFRIEKSLEEATKAIEFSKVALEDKESLMMSLRNENGDFKKEQEISRKAIFDLKEMINKAEQREQDSSKQLQNLHENLETVRKELKSKEETVEKLMKNDGNLNSVLKSKENEIKDLRTAIDNENKRNQKLQELKTAAEKELERLSEEKEKFRKAHLTSEENILAHQNTIKKMRDEIDDITFTNEGLLGEVRKTQSLVNDLNRQLNSSGLELEFYRAKVNSLEQANKGQAESIEKLENQIKEQSIHYGGTHETISSLQKQIKNLNLRLSNNENVINSLQKEKDELCEENQRLAKEKIDAICTSEMKENQEKKALQFEIQKLKIENDKLKAEINCSSSFDEGADGLIEKLNKQIEVETKSRKVFEKKVNDLETTVTISENRIRELNHMVSELEQKNLSLVQSYCNDYVPKEEVKHLKDQLDNIRFNLNHMADLFQTGFYKILQSKDDLMKNFIAELEKVTETKSLVETELSNMKNFELINHNLIKEIEDLIKSRNFMKNEIDTLSINNVTLNVQIEELNNHIAELESNFNTRESEILKIKELYNEKIESLKVLENNLSEKIVKANDLLLAAESIKDERESIDKIVTPLNKKINDLTNEINELKIEFNVKELEVQRLSKLAKLREEFSNKLAIDSSTDKHPVEVIEVQRLVSSLVTDKESLRAIERKKLINCNCKLNENVKLVNIPMQNREECIRLENENSLITLKLKQVERELAEQVALCENMKSCVSVLKKRK